MQLQWENNYGYDYLKAQLGLVEWPLRSHSWHIDFPWLLFLSTRDLILCMRLGFLRAKWSQGRVLCWSQTIDNQCYGCPSLCGSYYDCNTSPAITIKKLCVWGEGLNLQVLEMTQHTRSHTVRSLGKERQRQRERGNGPGILLLLGLGFAVLLFIGEL